MAEAALQTKIEKAEAAVAKANDAVARAQAAHDAELGHNKALCLEMLVAEKNVLVAKKHALAQLGQEQLNQQQVSTGKSPIHK